jgi:TolA-binding protein
MRTHGTDRAGSTSRRRTGTIASRAAAGLVLAAALLAGCSAGNDSATGADMSEAVPDELAGGDRGGDVAADGGAPAEAGADAGADAGTETGADVAGGSTTAADVGGRQVITSGELGLVADDPRGAADLVVAVVEQAGGRVDARQETAAREDEGTEATADLTVRVPADTLTDVLDALDEIGEVDHLDLGSDDVTAASQDLDARIRAMQLSVARMEDLLSRASTQADIISAESTLTERQASLEQLQSERARIAEQVALSTLRVSIWTAPEREAPPEPAPEPRGGFLGGLESGWEALVAVLGGVVLVLGVLLPWLVAAGVVGAAYLAVVRALRRRRTRAADAGGPGSAAGPSGPDGSSGPDEGPDPTTPVPDDREPVGAGSR